MLEKITNNFVKISTKLFKFKIPQIFCTLIMIIYFIKNLLYFKRTLWTDTQNYIGIASSLNFQNMYETYFREPLWIWVVKLSLAIFRDPVISVRILGFFLFAFTGFMGYKFVKDYTKSTVAATISLFFLFLNPYLISVAVNCSRDLLILALMPVVCYLTLIKSEHLSEKRRLFYWTIVLCMIIGTRINLVVPAVLCFLFSSFYFKIKIWKAIFPILIAVLIISPYLFYCQKTYGDPLYSVNLHAMWWRNYEFLIYKNTGCPLCPSFELFNKEMNIYGVYNPHPPITSFEYMFKLRPISELLSGVINGFSDIFLMPSQNSTYLTGGKIFVYFNNGNVFNPFYLLYIIGFISCLLSKSRFIILIPVLFLNLLLFMVHLKAIDPRMFSPATPYICIIMGIGYFFLIKKIIVKFGSIELLDKFKKI